MTRREFLDSATTIGELAELCVEYGIEIDGENIISCGDLDGNICDDIIDETRRSTWDDIRDALNEIDDSASWYIRGDCLEYRALGDEDFDEILEEAIFYCESNGIFEDDEETEEVMEEVARLHQLSHDRFRFSSGIGYDDTTDPEEDGSWVGSADVKVMSLM